MAAEAAVRVRIERFTRGSKGNSRSREKGLSVYRSMNGATRLNVGLSANRGAKGPRSAQRPIDRETSVVSQTFKIMFFLYRTYNTPYQKRTNVMAKANEALMGLSQVAKKVW